MKLYSVLICIVFITSAMTEECSQQPTVSTIFILGDYYLMDKIRDFQGAPPDSVRYSDENIYFLKDGETFVIEKNAAKEKRTKTKVNFKRKKLYVDMEGNRILNENKITTLHHFANGKMYKIATEHGYKTDQMTVCTQSNRIYLVGYQFMNDRSGSLYAFDTNNLTISGKMIEAQKIESFENRIILIDNEFNTGKMVLILWEGEDKWSVNVMEIMKVKRCKEAPDGDGRMKALKSAIKNAGERIMELYEEAMEGKNESEILKRNGNVVYANGGPVRGVGVPNYDPTKSQNYNHCDAKRSAISKRIEKMRQTLKMANEKYEVLYNTVMKRNGAVDKLMEYRSVMELYAPLNKLKASQVAQDKEKEYVCVEDDKFKQMSDNMASANEILSTNIKWVEGIIDGIDSDEHTTDVPLYFRS